MRPSNDRKDMCRRLPPRFSFDENYVRRLIAEDPETERHFTEYFGDLLSIKLRSRLHFRAAHARRLREGGRGLRHRHDGGDGQHDSRRMDAGVTQ
jgi:hypothetical protein